MEHHAADIQAIQASPLQGMCRPVPKTLERRPGPGERVRAGIPPLQPQPQARRDGEASSGKRLRNRLPQRLSGLLVGMLEFTDAHVDAAVDYSRHHYHDSSLEMSDRDPTAGVLSETKFALPREALDLYLKDPLIADLMTEMGWSMEPEDSPARIRAM